MGSHCEEWCKLTFCGVERTRYVYGLLDRRINDIFYIGSTFDLQRRFQEHVREHPYVQAMLERGLFPIPLVLLAYETSCDVYSREVERSIAVQLRRQGHSAFGDDTRCAWARSGWFYILAEAQAHQFAVLCEMYNS